ncbi:hypothetical protein WMO13_06550 [Ignatzschineria larvae DSM 13226]|uniref:Uncharacterized protein n=2 Tax=Ignatzschineria larvae TaxID=112009 RepID=A0ABZ3BX05_9GAMM
MIQKRIEELSNKQVVVGAIDGGVRENGMTNAELLAIHEFGAVISHPGGTSYGYRTERQAKQGKVRFLGKGQGYMELGKTGAHTIVIPERPLMRTSLKKAKKGAQKLLSKSVAECLNGDISADQAYEEVGRFLKTTVVNTFIENDFAPLSSATIKRKKSSGTLIDEGKLRNSINYEVRDRE